VKGLACTHLIGIMKKQLHKTIFPPMKFLEAMDLFSGLLNYQGIHVLHWIKAGGKKYAHGAITPSKSMIRKVATQLTAFASRKIPPMFFHTESGKGFEFDMKHFLQELWKATGKDKLAKQQPTEVMLTADGVMLSKNLNIVMMGQKEMDALASMPLITSAEEKQQ